MLYCAIASRLCWTSKLCSFTTPAHHSQFHPFINLLYIARIAAQKWKWNRNWASDNFLLRTSRTENFSSIIIFHKGFSATIGYILFKVVTFVHYVNFNGVNFGRVKQLQGVVDLILLPKIDLIRLSKMCKCSKSIYIWFKNYWQIYTMHKVVFWHGLTSVSTYGYVVSADLNWNKKSIPKK